MCPAIATGALLKTTMVIVSKFYMIEKMENGGLLSVSKSIRADAFRDKFPPGDLPRDGCSPAEGVS